MNLLFIFSVDRSINRKRTEKARSALLQKFSFFFRLTHRSTEKNVNLFLIIYFSFNVNEENDHFNPFKRRIIPNF